MCFDFKSNVAIISEGKTYILLGGIFPKKPCKQYRVDLVQYVHMTSKETSVFLSGLDEKG